MHEDHKDGDGTDAELRMVVGGLLAKAALSHAQTGDRVWESPAQVDLEPRSSYDSHRLSPAEQVAPVATCPEIGPTGVLLDRICAQIYSSCACCQCECTVSTGHCATICAPVDV